MIHEIKYYARRFQLWRHRKDFPYWWGRLHCTTCGKNVFKHKGDFFMLKPEIWEKAATSPITSPRMVLCRKCTERLLGRKLQASDYACPEDFYRDNSKWYDNLFNVRTRYYLCKGLYHVCSCLMWVVAWPILLLGAYFENKKDNLLFYKELYDELHRPRTEKELKDAKLC